MMLDRLVGLETEYATLVRLPRDQLRPPSRRQVYQAVCAQIARRIPTAPGRYDEGTLFLANGGAFSMETNPLRSHLPGGLIEGATAEARSPSQLVQCQRAQDRMIAEAAAQCGIPGRITIIKNSCDAQGHVYGCQENYSAPVASGGMLWVYWAMMLMVLPCALLYWTVCISVLATEMAVIMLVGGPMRMLSPRLLAATAAVLRLVSVPTAATLYFVSKTVAFRRQRKYLTAFLVSRVVLTGAGHVDRCNRFRLSSKAMAIDSVIGFGGYVDERPIFVFHHWLQQLCGRSLLSTRSISEMFHRRQRLQIGLSDSNVSDTAEFLKVGTTSLVLDMIESGGGAELPRLRRPIEALHRISADWHLVSRVATSRGEMSGLDIQRAYLKACRRYVLGHPGQRSDEALLVLRRWEETLDALAAFGSAAMDPRPGLGHVDWLTKKWMLDRLDETDAPSAPDQATCTAVVRRAGRASWSARKKVDIRYHELTEDGYYSRLRCAAPEVSSVDPAGIEIALRLPPSGSPAARRGQLIREFADGTQPIAADWSHVVIGTGKERRVVTLG